MLTVSSVTVCVRGRADSQNCLKRGAHTPTSAAQMPAARSHVWLVLTFF